MVFSSLFFIFAFLVLCYGIYLFAPSIKAKNTVLLVFSLIFYAWAARPWCFSSAWRPSSASWALT